MKNEISPPIKKILLNDLVEKILILSKSVFSTALFKSFSFFNSL